MPLCHLHSLPVMLLIFFHHASSLLFILFITSLHFFVYHLLTILCFLDVILSSPFCFLQSGCMTINFMLIRFNSFLYKRKMNLCSHKNTTISRPMLIGSRSVGHQYASVGDINVLKTSMHNALNLSQVHLSIRNQMS